MKLDTSARRKVHSLTLVATRLDVTSALPTLAVTRLAGMSDLLTAVTTSVGEWSAFRSG
jgi:hypothetical protein